MTTVDALPIEVVPIASLLPHPRNYKAHPEDQIAHLAESIRANGLYRNIVVAEDSTILAGHGVVQAARTLGMVEVPVVRLPLAPSSPAALKVLAGDNEVMHLGERDDRALSELLREVKALDLSGLLGTGYDEAMLANLVLVTRPASEIASIDEAAQWAGMPAYETKPEWTFTLQFRTEGARAEAAAMLGLALSGHVKSYWWPPEDRADLTALRIQDDD